MFRGIRNGFPSPSGVVLVSLWSCLAFSVAELKAADPKPQARVAELAFEPSSAKGEYHFDTGLFAGTLRRRGKPRGAYPVTDKATNTQVAGRYGWFSHYRVLTSDARYGHAAWDWPSTSRLLSDGAVETHWPATEKRPVAMKATYRWAAPDTLDVVTVVTAHAELPRLEVFLASYFRGFPQSLAYVQDQPRDSGRPGFLAAEKSAAKWHAFPRDEEAVSIIRDGRWKRPPSPVAWTIRPRLAAPLAMRRAGKNGMAALIMARPADCFAVSMPYGEEGHGSVYLSLFGRTLEKGETARAPARLVIGKDISDEEAVKLYETFIAERHSSPAD